MAWRIAKPGGGFNENPVLHVIYHADKNKEKVIAWRDAVGKSIQLIDW